MESTIEGLREALNKRLSERSSILQNIHSEKENLSSTKLNVENLREALNILQEVAKTVQEHAHERISKLVSKCLAIVFDDPYTFEIEFQRKRNKTEAILLFRRRGQQLDPLDASGGGVVDVAAFALRLSCLSLRIPQQRHLVVMDEPFRNVSPGYRPRIKKMLEMLTEELGFQFILATNMKSIQAGNIFEMD